MTRFWLWGLAAPAAAILVFFLIAPLGLMTMESFRPFVPGRIGSGTGWTLANYTELIAPAYAFYFFETFRIGAITSLLSLAMAAPLAWTTARTRRRAYRNGIIALFIGLLFMSLVARLYAVQVTFGSTGPLAGLGNLLGIPPRSPGYAVVLVVIGLLQFTLPVVGLMLIGTFQNLNPRLEEAALSLGAARWKAAIDIILPLALPGLLSAFLIAFAMCISNFVVPLILGRGVVLFTTNLMYTRFSDVSNYPSGAAIGILMLVLSFAVVYGLTAALRPLINRVSAR